MLSDVEKFIEEFPEVVPSENAMYLLKGRYFLDGETSWKSVCKRVTQQLSQNLDGEALEMFACRFFEAKYKFELMTATPFMTNSMSPIPQLFSCFVREASDNRRELNKLLLEASDIFAMGGGIGFNWSKVRAAGMPVGHMGIPASGVLKYMQLFDCMCETTPSGRSGRKGAMMALLDVYHPEIFKFVTCKTKDSKFSNFNISVLIDDAFMKAVHDDGMITFRQWKDEKPRRYSARRLFHKIVEQAWLNGEPGIIFIDTANKNSALSEYGPIVGSNPCGEILSVDHGVCNLVHVNLESCLVNGEFNLMKYQKLLFLAAQAADLAIDVNMYPNEKFEKVAKDIRPIGIGIMGFANLLYALNIKYDTQQARDLGNFLAKVRDEIVDKSSRVRALTLGPAPASKDGKHRNMVRTTIAPTGSVSMIANCSAAIEPNFALVMTKYCMDGTSFRYVNDYFVNALYKIRDDGRLTQQEVEGIIEEIRLCGSVYKSSVAGKFPELDVFVTALDIHHEDRISMQVAWQEYTDQSISSTINCAEEVTEKDIKNLIIDAHAKGLKGITVYRNNSRSKQPLNVGDAKNTWLCSTCGQPVIIEEGVNPELMCIICPHCRAKSCSG